MGTRVLVRSFCVLVPDQPITPTRSGRERAFTGRICPAPPRRRVRASTATGFLRTSRVLVRRICAPEPDPPISSCQLARPGLAGARSCWRGAQASQAVLAPARDARRLPCRSHKPTRPPPGAAAGFAGAGEEAEDPLPMSRCPGTTAARCCMPPPYQAKDKPSSTSSPSTTLGQASLIHSSAPAPPAHGVEGSDSWFR